MIIEIEELKERLAVSKLKVTDLKQTISKRDETVLEL